MISSFAPRRAAPRSSNSRGRTTVLVTAAAVLAVAVLTGCASLIGGVDRTYSGLPESLTEEQRAAVEMETPSVWWIEEDVSIALVTWGSSSCPRVVARIQAVSESEVALRLDPSGGPACTADMAAQTHEITLPRNIDGRPLTVTLLYPDGDESTQLTLP